jgi:RNA polymerase sigma factor (sigma-70 family)
MTNFNELSDSEIIHEVINGNASVFEILIRNYSSSLYKVGRSYGYNHQDVEDLMQETFINAYEHLDKLRNTAYFKTWLTRIMLNECYRKNMKSASLRKNLCDFPVEEGACADISFSNYVDEEATAGSKDVSKVIENAIKHIPPNYRRVFSLRELNGMSTYETALALNISEANVKVRLNRAKAMLRREVKKSYDL